MPLAPDAHGHSVPTLHSHIMSIADLLAKIQFPVQSKKERREILSSSSSDGLQRRDAAVEIQRVYRGYRSRKKLFERLKEMMAKLEAEENRAVSPARLRLERKHTDYVEHGSPISFSCTERSFANSPHLSHYMGITIMKQQIISDD
eukprot:sb/3473874/